MEFLFTGAFLAVAWWILSDMFPSTIWENILWGVLALAVFGGFTMLFMTWTAATVIGFLLAYGVYRGACEYNE